jgi:DMSO/TMAO reductase YedYZ molybdopterin-dependent catalytic subunit
VGLLGGRTLSDDQKRRLPPGQYLTEKWPVLHYGAVPRVDLAKWRLRVWGEVDNPFELTWDEFRALPRTQLHTDIHCVTRWSRLDIDFEGVAIQHVLQLARVRRSARFVLAHAEQGYTANLPLDVLDDDDVLLADTAEGEPLTPDHGFPLRLVVPKRYFWKSAKWLNGLQFLPADKHGFWERNGYHNEADPWREERFSGE